MRDPRHRINCQDETYQEVKFVISRTFADPFADGAGVNYINHNKTRANVKLVWSRHGITSHDEAWLNKSPEEMESSENAHLALDYVATRDIKSGDELFLDYGDLWEDAWQQHLRNWETQDSWPETYLNARAWNQLYGTAPLRNLNEAFYDPYPTNLLIRCHKELLEEDWSSTKEWDLTEYGFPCEIWDRITDDGGNFFYNVRIATEQEDRWDYDFDGPELYDIPGVPRHAIRFFDSPYSSDIQLKGAFRHEIGLPDELLPDAWRNQGKMKRDSSLDTNGEL